MTHRMPCFSLPCFSSPARPVGAPAAGYASQRGAAALLVTTLLCLALLLVVAFTGRDTTVAQRSAANADRGLQAFAAAEAGLAWATARLNDPARLDADCLPLAPGDAAAAGATSARERWLRNTGAEGSIAPATSSQAGTVSPLRATCWPGAAGWACSCPAQGAPVRPPTQLADEASAAAFTIEFAPHPRPGTVRLVAVGCTRDSTDCMAAEGGNHEAVARTEILLALLPALRSAPVAALTVRGSVDAGSAALGAHHTEAGGAALALRAGGSVSADALRLGVPAGSPLAGALVAGDAVLAGLEPDRLFARHFGMEPTAWAAQPAVRLIACSAGTDCGGALAAAAAGGARLLVIEGGATLAGPLHLGSPTDPVALVIRGHADVRGAVAVHGIVSAGSMEWRNATAADAFVRGATVVGGDYGGDGAPDFIHDDDVLALLQHRAGSFVRVPGSWKDF